MILRSHASWDPYIFFSDPYGFLEVRNKVVLDVGGAIGDSAIYFASEGAKRVYVLEPFPYSFEVLLENVKINGFVDIIYGINAAISYSAGTSMVSRKPSNTATVFSQSRPQSIGGSDIVQITTLSDIVKEYDLQDAVLKMDCEGCEYEAILNSEVVTLRKFTRILVEYHRGFKGLVEKLESADFEVAVLCNEGQSVGYLRAIRNDRSQLVIYK